MAPRRSTLQHMLRGLLVLLAIAQLAQLARAAASPGANIVDEELTEDQIAYYRDIFEQYDEDKDQRISMEENLAQDKVIADDQQKPFDEVSLLPAGRGATRPRALTLWPARMRCVLCAFAACAWGGD